MRGNESLFGNICFKHHGMSEDGFLYVYVVEGQGQTMYVYPVFSVSYYHFVIYFFIV